MKAMTKLKLKLKRRSDEVRENLKGKKLDKLNGEAIQFLYDENLSWSNKQLNKFISVLVLK